MIFVTGASGLIGSFICKKLIKEGYVVKALKRHHSDLSLVQEVAERIHWVEGDLLNISEVEGYLEGVDKIIHCAAFVSYSKRDEELLYQINVEGTANLVNWAITKKIKLFLHLSSVASIGKDKHSVVSNEDTKWTNDTKKTTYAQSKHQSELEVWRGWAEGLNTIIINPSLVLGPGNWHKSSTQLFKYIAEENRFYTRGIVNYVDVRDVAEVTLRLLESERYGHRYIVNAGSVAYKELFEKIAAKMGKKAPSVLVSGVAIKLAIFVEKTRSRLSGRDPVVTDELEQVSKNQHVYANEKIKKEIGIQFNDLDETLSWTTLQLLDKSSL